MPKSRLVELDYDELLHQTEKAWLFLMEDNKEQWIPKSLGELDEDAKTVTVPEYWALKEELI